MKPLATSTIENNDIVVSILAESVREATIAYQLRDDIIALIKQSNPTNIAIDLAKVKLIGSVGFLAFLGVRRHLGGGRIILYGLSDPIRDMFAACRLIPAGTNATAPFELALSREESLARLAMSPTLIDDGFVP